MIAKAPARTFRRRHQPVTRKDLDDGANPVVDHILDESRSKRHRQQPSGLALDTVSIPHRAFVAAAPARPRLVVYPMLGPPKGIDVTQRVIGAVAQELWERFGGNDVVNWLEAERLLGEAIQNRGSQPAAS